MTYSISVLEGLASPLVGPPVVFPSLATFPVRRILAPTPCSSTHSVCAPPPPEPSQARPPLAHVSRSAMGRGRGDRHSSQLRHSADTAHKTGRLHRHELSRHVCQHAANTGSWCQARICRLPRSRQSRIEHKITHCRCTKKNSPRHKWAMQRRAGLKQCTLRSPLASLHSIQIFMVETEWINVGTWGVRREGASKVPARDTTREQDAQSAWWPRARR
jgi:hypothetical protein